MKKEKYRKLVECILNNMEEPYTHAWYAKQLGIPYSLCTSWCSLVKKNYGVMIRSEPCHGLVIDNPEYAREVFGLEEKENA